MKRYSTNYTGCFVNGVIIEMAAKDYCFECVIPTLCSKCHTQPKVKGQSYCRACYNRYVKEYRRQKRIAKGKPPAQSRQPVQRPAVDSIPESVKARIVHDGNQWAVTIRNGQSWERVFQSDDKDECLLLLGGIFGRDLRE